MAHRIYISTFMLGVFFLFLFFRRENGAKTSIEPTGAKSHSLSTLVVHYTVFSVFSALSVSAHSANGQTKQKNRLYLSSTADSKLTCGHIIVVQCGPFAGPIQRRLLLHHCLLLSFLFSITFSSNTEFLQYAFVLNRVFYFFIFTGRSRIPKNIIFAR